MSRHAIWPRSEYGLINSVRQRIPPSILSGFRLEGMDHSE